MNKPAQGNAPGNSAKRAQPRRGGTKRAATVPPVENSDRGSYGFTNAPPTNASGHPHYPQSPSARPNRRATRGQCFRARSHSHTLTTRHPAFRSVFVTTRSRSRFRPSFAAHHSARFFGIMLRLRAAVSAHEKSNFRLKNEILDSSGI